MYLRRGLIFLAFLLVLPIVNSSFEFQCGDGTLFGECNDKSQICANGVNLIHRDRVNLNEQGSYLFFAETNENCNDYELRINSNIRLVKVIDKVVGEFNLTQSYNGNLSVLCDGNELKTNKKYLGKIEGGISLYSDFSYCGVPEEFINLAQRYLNADEDEREDLRGEMREKFGLRSSFFTRITGRVIVENKCTDFTGNNFVDFDDFFLFADNFGMTNEDETFDDKFDLDNDGFISLEDFFLFADNFGKSVECEEIFDENQIKPLLFGDLGDIKRMDNLRERLNHIDMTLLFVSGDGSLVPISALLDGKYKDYNIDFYKNFERPKPDSPLIIYVNIGNPRNRLNPLDLYRLDILTLNSNGNNPFNIFLPSIRPASDSSLIMNGYNVGSLEGLFLYIDKNGYTYYSRSDHGLGQPNLRISEALKDEHFASFDLLDEGLLTEPSGPIVIPFSENNEELDIQAGMYITSDFIIIDTSAIDYTTIYVLNEQDEVVGAGTFTKLIDTGLSNVLVYSSLVDTTSLQDGHYKINVVAEDSELNSNGNGFTVRRIYVHGKVNVLSGSEFCKELIQGHNGLGRVNVIFLGFNFNDKSNFIQKSTNYVYDLNRHEPFKSNSDKFNYWYIDELFNVEVTGSESGSEMNLEMINRLSEPCSFFPKQIVAMGNWDFRAITWLINGNGIIRISPSSTKASLPPSLVFPHEFGHSFGEFFDEYNFNSVANFDPKELEFAPPNCEYDPTYSNFCNDWCSSNLDYKNLFPSFVNVISCTSIDNKEECLNVVEETSSKKLCKWLEGVEPVFDANCVPDITFLDRAVDIGNDCNYDLGCFRGCGYSDWFRSSDNNIMASGNKFNSLQINSLCEKIEAHTGSTGGICACIELKLNGIDTTRLNNNECEEVYGLQ